MNIIPNILTQRIKTFQRESLTFDVIDSGPLDGQIFVLLHGFPETNKSWQETSEILISKATVHLRSINVVIVWVLSLRNAVTIVVLLWLRM